jgi:hypothetical protein
MRTDVLVLADLAVDRVRRRVESRSTAGRRPRVDWFWIVITNTRTVDHDKGA